MPVRYVLLLTFVFFTFSTVIGLLLVNKGIKPTLLDYAESMNQKIAASAVSDAIKKIKEENLNQMIKTKQNNKGNIASVDIYPGIGNKITAQIQQDIQSYLDGAEEGNLKDFSDLNIEKSKGEILYSVPLGRATDNVLLGDLGPNLPIKLHVIGDTEVNFKPEIGETGINGTVVMLNIYVKVNVQTIIPFATEVKTYEQTIPLPAGIYNMDVPQYYNGNGESSPPSIQLDGEETKEKTKKK